MDERTRREGRYQKINGSLCIVFDFFLQHAPKLHLMTTSIEKKPTSFLRTIGLEEGGMEGRMND